MKVLVFTDAGEEIDDELALWYLYPKVKMSIVFCGPTPEVQNKRLRNWETKYHKKLNQLHFMITLDQYKKLHSKHHYAAVLQISPLFGFDSDLITFDKYILMGSVDNSVNCPKGSVDLFRRAVDPIVIESSEALQMRPNKRIMNEIPDYFRAEMYKVNLRLLLVRCDPDKVYAEGLVNPEVGRGANFYTVQKTYEIATGKRSTPDFVWREDISDYVSSLVNVRQKTQTTAKMSIMYKQLDEIFGFHIPVITEKNFTEFLESRKGGLALELFRGIAMEYPGVLNPLYDLYAAWRMMNPVRDDFLNEFNGPDSNE